jgi:hypothetical protein
MTRVLAQARRERQVPYLADADFARIEREVRQGFRALVGDPVRVDVEPVAVIPVLPGARSRRSWPCREHNGPMRRFLSRLRDAYRAQGPRLPLVAARWLVRPEYLVVVRDLSQGTPTFEARDATHWSLLSEADLPAILALSPALTEREIRRLWAEGQECLTCWIDGELVFYCWNTAGPAYLPYLHRTFVPRSGDLLLSQIYTHPAYRTRGLLSASSPHFVPRARERGARRTVGLVAWWNRIPLHVARDKYRYTVVGTIGYWRLGPWRRYFSTGLVRLEGRSGVRVEELPGG